MKFEINDYKGNYAMHCKTEAEAKSFCKYLHEHGRRWNDGGHYKNSTQWEIYGADTIYFFDEGMFGHINGGSSLDGYTILEWSDFMDNTFAKGNLKTGDVILRRNGEVEIVNRELKMFIRKEGWNSFDDECEDLTTRYPDNGWDIIAVRRPIEPSDCRFRAFELKLGTLVYEREKIEEMTLVEVCKLLGKNIKIIQ
jgi:hypothetical protein